MEVITVYRLNRIWTMVFKVQKWIEINNYDRNVTNWIYNISPCNTIV